MVVQQVFAVDHEAAVAIAAIDIADLGRDHQPHFRMTKAAIMGAGAAKSMRTVSWGVAKEMIMAWVLTFPGCGLIGFLLAKLFLVLF